jgi:hypothetical protein
MFPIPSWSLSTEKFDVDCATLAQVGVVPFGAGGVAQRVLAGSRPVPRNAPPLPRAPDR